MIRSRFDELRLKRARETGQRRLTLEQIAEDTGLSVGALHRLSANKNTAIHISTLDALCEYFQCDVGDLLNYAPSEK